MGKRTCGRNCSAKYEVTGVRDIGGGEGRMERATNNSLNVYEGEAGGNVIA